MWRSFRSTAWMVTFATLATGCAQQSAGDEHASTAPWPGFHSLRATTRPTNVISFEDAVDLASLATEDTDADMVFALKPPVTAQNLFFGELRNAPPEPDPAKGDQQDESDDSPSSAGAFVARRVNGKWKAVAIEVEGLENAEWMYVGAGPHRQELWGILDNSATDQGDNLVLIHSSDDGATWNVSAIHKPAPQCNFQTFALDRKGHGRVTFYLDADIDLKKGIRAGYYHFRTTDGGKTWSAPEFESDSLTPADEVPESDQPDLGANAMQAMARAGATHRASQRP